MTQTCQVPCCGKTVTTATGVTTATVAPVLTPAEREQLRGLIATFGTRADMSAFLRLEDAAR